MRLDRQLTHARRRMTSGPLGHSRRHPGRWSHRSLLVPVGETDSLRSGHSARRRLAGRTRKPRWPGLQPTIGHDKGSESDGTNLPSDTTAPVPRPGNPRRPATPVGRSPPQRDAAYEADQGHGGGLPEHSEGHLAAKEAEGFEKADLLAPTGNTHHQHVQKCGYAEDDEHRPQDQRKVHRLTEIDEIRRRYGSETSPSWARSTC